MSGPCAHLLRLNELELHAAPGPGDSGAVVGVLQQRDQELPELQRAAPELGVLIAEYAAFIAWKIRIEVCSEHF